MKRVNSAAGAIDGAIAREDARVILAGRSRAALDELADALRATGGLAEVAIVDVLDAVAVGVVIEDVAQAGP